MYICDCTNIYCLVGVLQVNRQARLPLTVKWGRHDLALEYSFVISYVNCVNHQGKGQ